MNERIRELAEQAKGFVDLNKHVGGDNGCMVYTYDGLAKFAELIVRECAELAKHHVMNISTYGDAEFVDEQIKEHFGVEE
jgi:hypothetical protein